MNCSRVLLLVLAYELSLSHSFLLINEALAPWHTGENIQKLTPQEPALKDLNPNTTPLLSLMNNAPHDYECFPDLGSMRSDMTPQMQEEFIEFLEARGTVLQDHLKNLRDTSAGYDRRIPSIMEKTTQLLGQGSIAQAQEYLESVQASGFITTATSLYFCNSLAFGSVSSSLRANPSTSLRVNSVSEAISFLDCFVAVAPRNGYKGQELLMFC